MSSISVGDTLKRFAANITSSKLNERKIVFGDLKSCISDLELPVTTIKGVLRVLTSTLSRYHDRSSRMLSEMIIKQLVSIEKYSKELESSFVSILKPVVYSIYTNTPSLTNAGSALVLLRWTCIVIKGISIQSASFSSLVELLSYLYNAVAADSGGSVRIACDNHMNTLFKSDDVFTKILVCLVDMGKDQIHVYPLLNIMLKNLKSLGKDYADVYGYKDQILESFIKNVVSSKSRCQKNILSNCSDLLRTVEEPFFNEKMLPAMERSLLRNPEVAVPVVNAILSNISIEIGCTEKLSSQILSNIYNKDRQLCNESIETLTTMYTEKTESKFLKSLASKVFEILSGKGSVKVTLADQRCNLLTVVGNLGDQNLVDWNDVFQHVIGLFTQFLSSEANESTLVYALSMLTKWTKRPLSTTPDNLLPLFKKGMSLKSATPNVTIAYLQCMNNTFKDDIVDKALAMKENLMTICSKINVTNTHTVVQFMYACSLVLKFKQKALLTDDKDYGKVKAILTDTKNNYFSNEKFLISLSDEVKESMLLFVETILVSNQNQFEEDMLKQYYTACVHCLVTCRQRQLRLAQYNTLERMLAAGSTPTRMCLSLVDAFVVALDKQRNTSNESLKTSPRLLHDSLVRICKISNDVPVKKRESIALRVLPIMHDPLIAEHNQDAWVETLFSLELDASDFISRNIDRIISDLDFEAAFFNEQQANTLTTLVRIGYNSAMPRVVKVCAQLLTSGDLSEVTSEQVDVYATPPALRYQQHISKFQTDKTLQNFKKEGKNYSYAEQLMDLELQKEQDRKKGVKAVKLSKKEQASVDELVEEDSKIRKMLTQKYNRLSNTCLLIQYCIKGCSYELPRLLVENKILDILQSLLDHPLVYGTGKTSCVKVIYTKCVDMLLEEPFSKFTSLIVEISDSLIATRKCRDSKEVRSLRPQLSAQLCNLSASVATFCCGSSCGDGGDGGGGANGTTVALAAPMSAPAFNTLLLPFGRLLKSGGDLVKCDKKCMLEALRIIEIHAKKILKKEDTQNNASLLNKHEMLTICIEVISLNENEVQKAAEKAMIHTAACNAGANEEDIASPDVVRLLLNALNSPCARLRTTVLMCLLKIADNLMDDNTSYDLVTMIKHRVFVAMHDARENIVVLANNLWNSIGLDIDNAILDLICRQDVIHSSDNDLQFCASRALYAMLRNDPEPMQLVLPTLLQLYQDMLYMPPIEMDKFGRPLEQQAEDQWFSRVGIALSLKSLAELYPEDQILSIFNFLIEYGLNDRNTSVKKAMLVAAINILDIHGKNNLNALLPVFKQFLSDAPQEQSYDDVRQSVVVLTGSIACHLDKDDDRVLPIVYQLVDSLSTPSEQVQEAVSNSLTELIKMVRSIRNDLSSQLLDQLLKCDNYAKRRGAAYGLAGIVKGLGIMSLNELKIMDTLDKAIQNKKSITEREGALFAFELLSSALGRSFEPYVVRILPYLLTSFGDSNSYIRKAADDTSKVIMSKLSAHGVKLILPSLLVGLEEDSWRTKAGSVELLGTMAYCAPKQLSSCLPAIVPKLVEVLADSHNKVRDAGTQALKQVGAVIRNPEIQAISHVLLAALQDPSPKRNQACLEILLETSFDNFFDAPSLALIMPVVIRAFNSRSTETRKMSSQLIGTMYSITDQKDLSAYLPLVIPGLKQTLLDPAPDVRTASAIALGAMVKVMGDTGFQQLVPWLMETLVSETSNVDRSGAAQGLSEVVGGMGIAKLQGLMPGIIDTASRSDISPFVKDGYIMMFIYLPVTFKEDFHLFIAKIIPCILKALADETEYVRETSLKAGQRIVNMYAESAIELLLPELENGLFHENWRIRYSSIQLVGDLLYRLSGVTGKMSTDSQHDDDNFGSEMSQAAILKVLGEVRMNRVLAGLYMGRSDTALTVRTAALHVWKTIVSHTPKTLREILPTLFGLLLGSLASQSYDKRQVAARTLGDIVRKLGEKVLPEIIPILENGLNSNQCDQRQGVCIGLSEIMSSTSREHVQIYADSLISTVTKALLDKLPEVRSAAAKTFDNLHTNIGSRTLDDIIPKLINTLNDEDNCEYALDALTQVMAVKSRVVLPMLVPFLIAPPMNTRVVSLITSVAGTSLNPYLSTILSSLLICVAEKHNTSEEQIEMKHAEKVVLSVKNHEGICILINELLSAMDTIELRYVSVCLLMEFARALPASSETLDNHLSAIYLSLYRVFTIEDDQQLTLAAAQCLATVLGKIDTCDLIGQIPSLRQSLRITIMDYKDKDFPGFSTPKYGIKALLNVFREGILNGSPDAKEIASLALYELVDVTSPQALKPSVIQITGPSIRILGDKYGATVKNSLLDIMKKLFTKCGVGLKSFLPQLQTTFMKSLNDPERSVRLHSADAMSSLAAIHQRVDPLVNELVANSLNLDKIDFRETNLQTLRGVLENAGMRLSEKAVSSCFSALTTASSLHTESTATTERTALSACIGCLLPYLQPTTLRQYTQDCLFKQDNSIDWIVRHSSSIVLTTAVKQKPEMFIDNNNAIDTLLFNSTDNKPCIAKMALNGLAYLMMYQMNNSLDVSNQLLVAFCKSMKSDANDTKQNAAHTAAYVALNTKVELEDKVVLAFIPMLVNGIMEKKSTIKAWSETALVILLKLSNEAKDNKRFYNKCLGKLEAGMSNSLQDVYTSILKKAVSKNNNFKVDDIDDTNML